MPSPYPCPYPRVLLKISGEALASDTCGKIIDHAMVAQIANEISQIHADLQTEFAIVIGGGNIWRGARGAANGMNRTIADDIGMMATIMNSLAMKDALTQLGVDSRVMSALPIHKVCEDWIPARALSHLGKGRVVICAAGLGEPNFTTDTAAVQRAIQLKVDVLLKGTHGTVLGIYDKDPATNDDAILLPNLTYDEVIKLRLKVMDPTAFTHAEDAKLPTVVFNIMKPGRITDAIMGKPIGTLVTAS